MSSRHLGTSGPTQGPVRLLLVEDDLVFRRYVLAALAEPARPGSLQLQAMTVGSLREALDALAASPPDCILLDLGLPDSAGLHTLEALTKAAPGLPVVVLTGAEEEHLADAALLAGAQDFLEKDQLEPRSLARALRHALDRGEWAAQFNAKNRELEDRNRDLDDFAHAVSHDLKAPLRAIFHLVVKAQEELAAGQATCATQTLEAIEPRIRRLFAMIEGLLSMTRVGRQSNVVPVDVGSVVREVLESLPVPPGFRIEVESDPPIILATRTALAQVFQNLVDNAIKHHPGPSGRIRIGWSEGADHHGFSVCDDGAGIPEDQRERVFQLFHTVGAGADTGGVGLALVRKVVLAAGGRITVEPNLPRGTCFRIWWPKPPSGAGSVQSLGTPLAGASRAEEHKARMVA